MEGRIFHHTVQLCIFPPKHPHTAHRYRHLSFFFRPKIKRKNDPELFPIALFLSFTRSLATDGFASPLGGNVHSPNAIVRLGVFVTKGGNFGTRTKLPRSIKRRGCKGDETAAESDLKSIANVISRADQPYYIDETSRMELRKEEKETKEGEEDSVH